MVVKSKPFFSPVVSGEVEVVATLSFGEVSGATVSDAIVDSLELSVVAGSVTSNGVVVGSSGGVVVTSITIGVVVTVVVVVVRRGFQRAISARS